MSIVQQNPAQPPSVQIGSDIDHPSLVDDDESVSFDDMSRENTGRWTQEEHNMFLQGLKDHGKGWKKIAILIKTRTVVQIRTHAQKYFQKLSKAKQGDVLPVTMDVLSTASSPRKTKKKTGFTPVKRPGGSPSKPFTLSHGGAHMQHGMRPNPVLPMHPQAAFMGSGGPSGGVVISIPGSQQAAVDAACVVSLDKIVVPPNAISAEGSPTSISDISYMRYPGSGPGTPSSTVSSGHQSPVSQQPGQQHVPLQPMAHTRGPMPMPAGKVYHSVDSIGYQVSPVVSGGGWAHAIASASSMVCSAPAPPAAATPPQHRAGGDVAPFIAASTEAWLGCADATASAAEDSDSSGCASDDEEEEAASRRPSAARRSRADVSEPHLLEESSSKRRRFETMDTVDQRPTLASTGPNISHSAFSFSYDASSAFSISPVATSMSNVGALNEFLWEEEEPLNLDDVFRNCLDEHVYTASLLCGGGLEGVF